MQTVELFHPQAVDPTQPMVRVSDALGHQIIDAVKRCDLEYSGQTPSADRITNFLRARPTAIIVQKSDNLPRYLTAEVRHGFDAGAFLYGVLRLFNEPLWQFGGWDYARLYVSATDVAALRAMMLKGTLPPKPKSGAKPSKRDAAKQALQKLYAPDGLPPAIEKRDAVLVRVNDYLRSSELRGSSDQPFVIEPDTLRRAIDDIRNARSGPQT